MNSLIIEKPSLAPLPSRLGWGVATAFFWAVWVYLWMPLVTLVFWLFGVRLFGTFVDHTLQTDWRKFAHLVVIYAVVVCAMGGALLVWARIEFMRFRSVNRRTKPVPVSVEEVAEYVNLPVADLIQWTHARRILAYHDSHGAVVGGASIPDADAANFQDNATRAA